MKFLFVHPLEGNAYELFKAFLRNKSIEVDSITTTKRVIHKIFKKILYEVKLPFDEHNYNQFLIKTDLSSYDIIFIIKGVSIYRSTLKEIKKNYKNIKLVSWSLDDMYAKHNRSYHYTKGIKEYDVVFTTKSYNVEELKLLGAKNVYFHYQKFSKDVHKPYRSRDSFKYDIVFIGYPEKERFEWMNYLAENGMKVHVFGSPKWNNSVYKDHHENLIISSTSLNKEEYAKTIGDAKITLCFLRKINRDLHTSRSVEIPACGGFMLAENTNEHKDLFEEGKEAAYFNTKKELLEKSNYYLTNEIERERMVLKGMKRCEESGYSYDDLVKFLYQKLK